MASEPALFTSRFHRTFVRCVELPWPLYGTGHQAVCRGCPWQSGVFETYAGAHAMASEHMFDWAPLPGQDWVTQDSGDPDLSHED